MVFNIINWLWKQWPVEYTKEYYEKHTADIKNIVSADVYTDRINIGTKSATTIVKTNSSTVKTDSTTTIQLNLKPNDWN